MADITKRQNAATGDLLNWQEYISGVAAHMQSSDSSIDNVMNQIDIIMTQLQGLQNQIDIINASIGTARESYVNVNPGSVYIETMCKFDDSRKISIYSNKQRVYVYASKTVSGLTLDGVAVKADPSTTPFYYIDADMIGTKVSLKTSNISQPVDVSLYFCDANDWQDVTKSQVVGVQIRLTPQKVEPTRTTVIAKM